MVRRATGRRLDGSLSEAAALVARGPWDSTRAALLEGDSVAVLIAPQRRDERHASDVAVTVRPAPVVPADSVTVVPAGPEGCWSARLDALGRCTIRGVPDARYRVRLVPRPQGLRP
jgi:hypothetical protein